MYTNILYATDLEPESFVVANKASELTEAWGAKLSIIHVVENIPTAYGSPVVLDVEELIHKEAEKALLELANKLKIKQTDAYLAVGSTKLQILSYVDSIEADLLIVGSHGRHGLALLMGSTANAVLHSAPCDVLAVRMHKDDQQ